MSAVPPKGQKGILSFFGGGAAKKKAPPAEKDAEVNELKPAEAPPPEAAGAPAPPPVAEAPEVPAKAATAAEEKKAEDPMDAEGEEPKEEPKTEAVKSRKRLRKFVVGGDDDDDDEGGAALEDVEDMEDEEEEEEEAPIPKASKSTPSVHPMFAPRPAASPKPAAKPAKGKSPAKATASKPAAAGKDGAAKKAKAAPAEEDGAESESDDEGDDDDIEDVKDSPAKAIKPGSNKPAKAKAKKLPKGGKADGVGLQMYEVADKYSEYDPEEHATWKKGEPVPYLFLARAFEKISDTTKRLEIAQYLANVFRTVIATTPEDLLHCVYLSTNSVGPAHENIEMGIGESTLIKTICQATGKSEAVIKKQYNDEGDLGKVAVNAKASQRTLFGAPKPLTVRGVFAAFRHIATECVGTKSQEKRMNKIKSLLVASRESEAGYVVRSLQGKLRIGLAEQTVLQAIAHAVTLQGCGGAGREKDLAEQLVQADRIVKQVYSECPSYDQMIPALLEVGTKELPTRCHFVPGVPIKPMLAKPTNGVTEVLSRFADTEFSCEYKYDGERAQVHLLEDGSVHIYSRNLENNTTRFPDLIQLINRVKKAHVTSAVIDCEAVAYDRETKKIQPFQVLSTRGKKNIKLEDVKVPVMLFAFDLLYLNGKPYLQENLATRREALYSAFEKVEGEFDFATCLVTRDTEELHAFLDKSIEDSTEGLVVKTLHADATYEPSKRSLNWLKLKKDYIDGLGDSVDVVPIGAWWGKGKRTGIYGAYLLAVYDEESEEFQGLCKIGTGFSEEMLDQLHGTLVPHAMEQPRPYYKAGSLKPEVWLDAKVVWEIKAADLSISPAHMAAHGLVDPTKGIAMRFPRFIRVREDKGPEQATAASEVADMYRRQAVVQNNASGGGKGGAVDDDDM